MSGLIKSSSVAPGAVQWFAVNAAPAGWLACNGAAVSRTAYARLFAAVATTYGAGDGSTTFNLPDMRGEFIRGHDAGRGVDTGRTFGTAQAHDMAAHTHTLPLVLNDFGYPAGSGGSRMGSGSNTGSTGGTETRPRNVAMLACIKF